MKAYPVSRDASIRIIRSASPPAKRAPKKTMRLTLPPAKATSIVVKRDRSKVVDTSVCSATKTSKKRNNND